MENNKNKKSVKFQGDMLKFCDFIQVSYLPEITTLKVSFSSKQNNFHDLLASLKDKTPTTGVNHHD